MPRESEMPRASAHLAMTAMDGRGRLADRALVQLLNWTPRQQIWLTVHQSAIVARADECTGTLTSIDSQGFLRLPAQVRAFARLEAGDRVLILAECKHQGLALFLPSVVREALLSAAPDIWIWP